MNLCFELHGIEPNLSGYHKVVSAILKASDKGRHSVKGYYRFKDDLFDYVGFIDSEPTERWLEVMYDYAEDDMLEITNTSVTSAILGHQPIWFIDFSKLSKDLTIGEYVRDFPNLLSRSSDEYYCYLDPETKSIVISANLHIFRDVENKVVRYIDLVSAIFGKVEMLCGMGLIIRGKKEDILTFSELYDVQRCEYVNPRVVVSSHIVTMGDFYVGNEPYDVNKAYLSFVINDRHRTTLDGVYDHIGGK